MEKMPISRSEKEAIIQELQDKFKSSSVAIFTDYRGLSVTEVTRLRRRLREAGCEFKVAKNTLTGLAANRIGFKGLDPFLEGQTAIAFGEDPVVPAKVLTEFIREVKKMEIKGAVLEGNVVDAMGVKRLAELPPREALLARVAGGMLSPLYGFANVLQGTLRGFVFALEAIRKQRAGEA